MDQMPTLEEKPQIEIPVNTREQVVNVSEVAPAPAAAETMVADLDTTNTAIQIQTEVISSTTDKVNEIRHSLGLEDEITDVPSVDLNKKKVEELEERKAELERKLQEVLKSSVSEKYQDVIDEVKKSKIDWAHSGELARRLKLKGATEEDVEQIRNWLVDNATNARAIILPPDKFKEVVDVLSEMAGVQEIKEAAGFKVSEARKDLPEYAKNAVYVKEKDKRSTANTLHHEFGHITQDGLLHSGLYDDWNPSFKEGAPDKEYVGDIEETDTRIRAMYRELAGVFDPKTEVFGQEELDILKKKLKQGYLYNNKDVRDLFDHYDDETIIRLANHLPAI